MSGLTHVTVGTNDLEQARLFYDAWMATLGMTRVFEHERASAWGKDRPEILVCTPYNGETATFANGGTIGLSADDRATVDAWHAAALANGGSCEGPPGPRAQAGGAYGAYARDPDGNKFCIYSYSGN